MRRVPDILAEKGWTLSFELFPPKTEKGLQNLRQTLNRLTAFKPDYISCTYGAGGSTRGRTFEIVQMIQEEFGVVGVAHLTCVCHTKSEMKDILNDIKGRGIRNILALRGDPPRDNPDWKPGPDNFHYSSELCAFIRRQHGDWFGIGVAGFPEGHVLCRDRDQDAKYLKIKVENGADWVITQLFFDNQDYFDYVRRLTNLGVTVPVIPGILPIQDYDGLLRFTQLCGASLTEEVRKRFEPLRDDPEAVKKEGIRFAQEQAQALLDEGAPGLHFYCLNKAEAVEAILPALKRNGQPLTAS